MRTNELKHMRPQEILDAKKEKSIVYLPIGPLEWHGPAMPFGVDAMAAEYIAAELAKRAGGVVMPTLYCGTEKARSPEMLEAFGFEDTDQYIVGQDFPNNTVKSMYTKEDTFGMIIREYLRMLVEQGYQLIVVVNGHGADGQTATLERLAREFSSETGSRILSYMIMPEQGDPMFLGHANISETSLQMAICPEDVDLSMLPPKEIPLKNCDWGIDDLATFLLQPNEDKTVMGDPRDATVEIGRSFLDEMVNAAVKTIEKEYADLCR